MGLATVRRIRSRRADEELHTTRLVGAGWTWECDCGDKGSWSAHRLDAVAAAKRHRLEEHSRP